MLEGRGLSCTRGFATLFREVTFQVNDGEWLAVRGPNGSGKTTLLRCAAGLTRADKGDITRDGALLYSGHLPGIKDDLTTEENLKSALSLRGVKVDQPAIVDALARAGLEKRRQLAARRLSAGQRRRIGLARLMLDPSPIWVLDEPLTALDDEGQALFTQLLSRHLDRGGLAVLATHHDLSPSPARVLRMGA